MKYSRLKFSIYIIILSALVSANAIAQSFPKIELGKLDPEGRAFAKPINKSKIGELTIASFNVRNLGVMNRGLKDFELIADLVNEADVFVFQEVGLGVYRKEIVSESEEKRIQTVAKILQMSLDSNWNMIIPPKPTPIDAKNGRETAILMYKKKGNGFTTSGSWSGYVDLGDKRDMPTFKINCVSPFGVKEYHIGSVHLTPEDPYRGTQMIQATDWLIKKMEGENAMVLGDFNWGYRRKPRVNNYLGELYVQNMHELKRVFQPFYYVSYLNNGKKKNLRTNLGFRSAGKMYDQFLTTPSLAYEMADDGELLKDIGVLAFDNMTSIESKLIKKEMLRYEKLLKKFLKITKQDKEDIDEELYQLALKKFESDIRNSSTFTISDHRPIWIQFQVFEEE